MKRSLNATFLMLAAGSLTLIGFQNCSAVQFDQATDASVTTLGNQEVCNGISCSLDPLTQKAAVTTILLALGDEANNELTINGASSQLIAETLVRTSSPKTNPKILFAWDSGTNNETPEDKQYVLTRLLGRYDVTAIDISKAGLKAADLQGYDLVWFTNPGFPMASEATRDALLQFSGGVILEGDDLSHGANFSLESLTGMQNIDNGTSVACGSKRYNIDNNNGSQYAVSLDSKFFTGTDASTLNIHYGNDIDNAKVTRADAQVLAWGKADFTDCTELRPVIVRYEK